jgi:nicotinamidase-related amidase
MGFGITRFYKEDDINHYYEGKSFRSDVLHLAIDYQRLYAKEFYGGGFFAFAANAERFAEKLRERNVQTIWVALDDSLPYRGGRTLTSLAEKSLFGDNEAILTPNRDISDWFDDRHKLAVKPNLDDLILVKATRSAVDSDATRKFLEQRRIDTILVSGHDQTWCVEATVRQTSELKLNCWVIEDLMTGAFHPLRVLDNDSGGKKHMKAMADNPGVTLVSTEQALARLSEPPRPLRHAANVPHHIRND